MNHSEKHILRHSLGLDRSRSEYRNRFVTGPGTDDFAHCEALVAPGLMIRRGGSELTGGDYIYSVTEAGHKAATATDNGAAD